MKIKLEEIAIKSGYSIATVSRVLSGKAKGRSQSVYDIVHTARDLGYKTSLNQYKDIGIPIDIAVLTQHDAEEFYSCLYESFDRTASQMNIQISIHSAKHSSNLPEKIHRMSKFHDGIILMAPTLESKDYEMILKKISPYPIISIAPVNGNVLPLRITTRFQSRELQNTDIPRAGQWPRPRWENELQAPGK